jgi:hypothetical protein
VEREDAVLASGDEGGHAHVDGSAARVFKMPSRDGLRMRRLAAILLLAVLSGCATPGARVSTASTATTGPWHLDCTLGGDERAHDPAWVQECVARGSHTPGPKAEIALAVNPKDPNNVVIGSKDDDPESSTYCVWNGLAVTHDGGKTWKDVTIGGKWYERDPTSPYYGFACNTDPDLAFDAKGDVHYAVELYNLASPSASGPLGPDPTSRRALLTPGWKVVLATSHDGGDTWPDAVTEDVSDGLAAIIDYHRTVVNPKTQSVITAIRATSGGPVAITGKVYTDCHVLASRDGGKTADAPVLVNGPDAPPVTTCEALAASPNGTLVMLGRPGTGVSGAATEQQTPISISWSADDGRTWTTPAHSFDIHSIPGTFNGSQFRTGTNLELAYVPDGTLYALYAGNDRGNADVYVRSSHDDGHAWSEPVRVDQDAGAGQQWLANVAIPRDGSLHVFYLDTRYDPSNHLIDVTHGVSLDGGKTWADERVTNVSWDGDLGRHQERQSFIGDYLGAGASGDVVWGGFPDASNGVAPVIAAARVVSG